jgi:hypothetical protein
LGGPNGWEKDVRKGCRRVNMVEIICNHMKMEQTRPVETIPGMREGGQRRMMEGVNSTMIYCNNFINVTMFPQYNIKIKKILDPQNK